MGWVMTFWRAERRVGFFIFCSFIFKSNFLCLTIFFLQVDNLVWVLSMFWRKWVMELRILCPPKKKNSQARGHCPLKTPAREPLDPCKHLAHRLSFPQFKKEWHPMHKHAQRCGKAPPHFDDSWGEMSHSREFKISGSMESLVEKVQIENSLRNYVNFTLGNGLSLAFKTLKPMSFQGLRPLDPRCHDGISDSVQNYMWILPLILPSKTGFTWAFKMLKPILTLISCEYGTNWEFITKLYVNFTSDFTLINGFSSAFESLKPMSFRGLPGPCQEDGVYGGQCIVWEFIVKLYQIKASQTSIQHHNMLRHII